MKDHRNFSSLKWTGKGVEKDEMKWNAVVKESKIINTKQIISWYAIAKAINGLQTCTCLVSKHCCKTSWQTLCSFYRQALSNQILNILNLYLTFNKLHSRTSLNLGNCHFPFTCNEDEKTKLLVFLSKLLKIYTFLQLATDEREGICWYFHTCYRALSI